MTTELILLLALYAFILLGVFFGENGPRATFEKSAPRLAARMEANISTGTGFLNPQGGNSKTEWLKPDNQPTGGF